MSEIAKCPRCGKNPVVWCKDDEDRIRIMCCRFVVYTTSGWNQYAAAMELAKAMVRVSKIYRMPLVYIEGQLNDAVGAENEAKERVLEVFK